VAGGVEFHTGVPDTSAFACRLLRKAYRRGATVLCLAPAQRLELLDRALWTFVEREFVPHAVVGRAAARVLERSPIWLAAALPGADEPGGDRRDVVVNLGGALPVQTALATRVIEVVGAEADEAERGRALWRQYKALGLEVVHHPFRAAHGD
jgi:DNA polymerase-3 subunit chi